MNFVKKMLKGNAKENSVKDPLEAILRSEHGPVLKVVMSDLHLATLYFDGSRYCLIYHHDFLNAGIAPFNAEQLKRNDVPEIDKCYYSEVLWYPFASRIPSAERPDFKLLMEKLRLNGAENPLVILSKIGSVSISKPWRLELVREKA